MDGDTLEAYVTAAQNATRTLRGDVREDATQYIMLKLLEESPQVGPLLSLRARSRFVDWWHHESRHWKRCLAFSEVLDYRQPHDGASTDGSEYYPEDNLGVLLQDAIMIGRPPAPPEKTATLRDLLRQLPKRVVTLGTKAYAGYRLTPAEQKCLWRFRHNTHHHIAEEVT